VALKIGRMSMAKMLIDMDSSIFEGIHQDQEPQNQDLLSGFLPSYNLHQKRREEDGHLGDPLPPRVLIKLVSREPLVGKYPPDPSRLRIQRDRQAQG